MAISKWLLLVGIQALIFPKLYLEAQCTWKEGIPNAYIDSVKAVDARFFNQIRRIDSIRCQKNPIVFTGSSSIRIWKNLETSFPDLPICNTGFGGSTLPELLKYLPELVLNHKPNGLVIYCGENDISLPYSTVDDVVGQFKQLVDTINLRLPSIPVWVISVKPSLLSRLYLEKQNCVNQAMQSIINSEKIPRWYFVDVRSHMLNEAGEPRTDLYLRDGLHMNETGYNLWKEKLQEFIYPKSNKQ